MILGNGPEGAAATTVVPATDLDRTHLFPEADNHPGVGHKKRGDPKFLPLTVAQT